MHSKLEKYVFPPADPPPLFMRQKSRQNFASLVPLGIRLGKKALNCTYFKINLLTYSKKKAIILYNYMLKNQLINNNWKLKTSNPSNNFF